MENHRAPASTPILDKYRALVRDEGDVVGAYERLLSELTFNSKPIITELTIIAGDQKEHGEGIAHAICSRILEVPVDQKLPSLYLLDSIVKNIGCEYVRYFASQLPKVFCEAYNQVQSSLHPSMRHLFGTWSKVFHPSVLRKIEDELHISTTENQRSAALAKTRNTGSASPRPSHGIHVNPKYLEARRQLENSAAMGTMDAQKDAGATEFEDDAVDTLAAESPKGWSGAFPKVHGVGQATGSSSSIHGYRQKSPPQYDDYERPKVLPPHLGISKTGSPYTAAVQASAMDGDEGPMHLVKVEVSNHLSPRLRKRSASPLDDNFPRGSSSWRPAEIASSPHSRLGFVPSKPAIDQNGWMERHLSSNVGLRQLEASPAYDCNNGYRKKHLRELIDAYGNYRGQSTSLEKLPKVQRIDVNGMDREVVTKNWRCSEEEEYVWEDMSPTLANQSRRNSLLPLGPDLGSLSRRVALGRPDATILEPDCNRNTWPDQTKLHPVDDPAIIVDDRPVLGSVHGSMNKKFQDGAGSSFRHYHRVREPEKFPYSYQQELNSRSQGWGSPEPFASSSVTLPNGQKVPGPYEYSPDVEIPFQRFSSIHSDSLNVEASPIDKHMTIRPPSPPSGPAIWPPVHRSQASHLLPIPPNQKHLNSPFSFMEVNKPLVNQGPNSSVFLPQQQFDPADRKFSSKVMPLPHKLPGIFHKNQHTQEQCIGMAVQSQEGHEGYVPPVPPAQFSSQISARPLEHIQMQGQGLVKGSVLANSSLPAMATSIATQSVPDAASIQHGGVLPPLPPGPPPLSSQIEPTSKFSGSIISSSPSSAFSGLISTLMAQGLISLTPPTQSEGSVGTDFNAELLKVRHESVINALYANLPRQCTTCGLRFTCQEEHRNHMDWHVTKNRVSKNRKQKPSRKWFVNAKEWLSGTETVGTDVVPGFLPTETATEKKEEKEMAVPADENQIVCALCGEPFEDFYSDEAEEWMYKGAVYLNAVDGHIEGLDRSHLGPIVHEKCRPGSFEGS